MKKGVVVLFPGIRYSVDCPLLYYTRVSYEYAGYECVAADYGVEETDKLDAFADLAVKNLIKDFRDFDFSEYENVVFAEKSVGTVIGMRLEDELKVENVTHLVYTPIEATYTYLKPGRRIAGVAAGTEDKHIELKALRAACKKLGIPLTTIKGGGHRLEAGKDVTKDIGAIAQVVAVIADPSIPEKLRKAEEKAAAEREAAEKAKAEEEKKAAEKVKKSEQNSEKKASVATAGTVGKKTGKDVDASKNTVKKKAAAGNIRKYIPRDNEELMEIWLLSNVKEQSFISKKYWNKNFTEVKRVLGLGTVFVYEEGGHLKGFAGSMETVMVGIYVAEDDRDRGIGSLLLAKLKDEIGALEATVYTKNKRALEFFNRAEFKGKDISVDSATGEEVVLLEW